jgi:glycosyltransferase involved in cell wall biosynthesis
MTARNRKLKIAQVAPLAHPVFDHQNKAIYAHVAHLTNGFADKKYDVTLYGHPESKVKGTLKTAVLHYDEESKKMLSKYEQWSSLSDCYLDAKNGAFDLIHSHLNVMTSFFSRTENHTPTIISVHSPIEEWMKPILLKHKNEKYISFSLAQRRQMPELNWYANIYHGVDTDMFSYEDKPDNYVLFLGRLTKDKGAHVAIAASKEAEMPIRIAGRSYGTEKYWHEMIEPHINGENVRYFGEVSIKEKIPLIQKAKAIIFPIGWNEPFGYVLIEAMACGTPVIAFPNGSVPEIVKHGVTGLLVNNEEEMVEAIKNIDTIDRKQVRARAEQFFSLKKMLNHYDSVYHRVVHDTSFKLEKNSI